MRSHNIRTLNAILAAGLLGLAGNTLAAEGVSPNALEPCINGEVSASGRYPTQAAEDAITAAGANALEPAINGRVTSRGLYPNEDVKRQALGG